MLPRKERDAPVPGPKPLLTFPPCFKDEAHYDQWCYLAWVSDMADDPSNSFCYDCEPDFKAEMLEEGRCVRPGTEFWMVLEQDDEPQPHGLSAADRRLFQRLGRVIGKRIA